MVKLDVGYTKLFIYFAQMGCGETIAEAMKESQECDLFEIQENGFLSITRANK